MITLPTIEFSPRLQKKNDKLYIFDEVRKKFLMLTPEEWVRQKFIHLLLQNYGYHLSLFQVEKQLQYHQKTKRTDILIWTNEAKPYFLIECKAESVALSEQVLFQALTYNAVQKANYVGITNGKEYAGYVFLEEEQRYEIIDSIPFF
ncbi:MAG: type I restriction enzyme HsdR N-terminal domain-containing protein [Bacteroidetes bacterium]|nr:MAG: type I restriction enzyme HsdR N-terminal domain-containing protein [Bacteroidota bacterium]TAG87983.1 MAG: type I restriction enzyme HsdR N-terminal domain-containing protein [Bacteroidota bacterium]